MRFKFSWENIKKSFTKEKILSKDTLRKVLFFICICVFIYSASSIVIKFYKDIRTKNLYQGLRQSPVPTNNYNNSTTEDKDTFQLIQDSGDLNSFSVYPKLGDFYKGDTLAGNGRAIDIFYDSLFKINKDVVGYINIPGTRVNYPVLQSYQDNLYYLKHDITKAEMDAASIFLDYRNRIYSEDRNTIVYGHNMRNGEMFRDLHLYQTDGKFGQSHTKVIFNTLYETMEWEVFSTYKSNVSFDYIKTSFRSDKEFEQFIKDCVAKTEHRYSITPKVTDRILTLSTCDRTSEPENRFVVQAVLVKRTPR